MRRTPPQNKVDKLASPRVTLRLHQLKTRDEKKPTQSKPEVPPHDSRVQFSVKMDSSSSKVDDIYEFKSNKESSAARGTSAGSDTDKSITPSKLSKEADLRESLGSGNTNDQHSADSNVREEKLKSAEVELGKRSHNDANDGEDGDDETRRKKRREDRPESNKEMNRTSGPSGRPPGRGMITDRCPKGGGMASKSGGTTTAISGKVSAGSGGSSGGNTPTDRKSPNATSSPGASPRPTRVSTESGESEGEDGRRGEGGSGVGGPKVPPLKIVIPQQNSGGAEGGDQGGRNNGKNGSTRHHHHHPALPYVVSSGGGSETERAENPSSSVPNSSGTVVTAPSSQPSSMPSAGESCSANRENLPTNNLPGSKGDEKKDAATLSEERSQRVLRSSHRMANMHSTIPMPQNPVPLIPTSSAVPPVTVSTTAVTTAPVIPTSSASTGTPVTTSNLSPPNPPEPITESAPSASTSPALSSGPTCPVKTEEKIAPVVPTSSSTVGPSSNCGGEEPVQAQPPSLQQQQQPQGPQTQSQAQPAQQVPTSLPQSQLPPPIQQQQQPQQQQSSTSTVDLHPRKRKLKKESTDAAMDVPSGTVSEVHPHDQPITNCYELFLNIRKQIERRRKGLFPVQPKPPQGFKDYLMNRCTYVLAGNATSRLSVPITPPPQCLSASVKELFQDQEKERYRLRMQHVIEKEKLVLSVEQEILRVHGRAARALANQALPFSACTILKDEEVYNVITPEQEEKDRNARSRYNGRLFLSWLQDVDDKWEKIKEAMLLRHHNEAASLHAVQKMDWEWKLKELGLCEAKTKPVIEDHHVPMVHVSDDFDLLPA
ncbi:ankyrin repeat domain-containing protein 11 isoform X2 [Hetaerina americana]|uniref:ankyrin repeat domain-containing protein 11 isoform X2 n=1 Tax=Hetaerina americana TaxID=62018 RepID=UPI003A7F2304